MRTSRLRCPRTEDVRGCSRRPCKQELFAVVELSAGAHGEWIRIHHYANGNGRTARLWANWVAVRYGLPSFVRIKPRPGGLLYAQAAQSSMGDAKFPADGGRSSASDPGEPGPEQGDQPLPERRHRIHGRRWRYGRRCHHGEGCAHSDAARQRADP